jgi:hypothetical protein
VSENNTETMGETSISINQERHDLQWTIEDWRFGTPDHMYLKNQALC